VIELAFPAMGTRVRLLGAPLRAARALIEDIEARLTRFDPLTGRPAWTGVLTATALAPSAALAEALAKAAVLAGPERGRDILDRHGGVLFRSETAAVA
jgi:hypothetical protein